MLMGPGRAMGTKGHPALTYEKPRTCVFMLSLASMQTECKECGLMFQVTK